MDFNGIIEPGTPVIVVVYAPGATGAQVSKNGGPFAAATNAVSAISGGYFSLSITNVETNTPGPLLVDIIGAPAGTSVLLEVRSIVMEISNRFVALVQTQVRNPLAAQITDISSQVAGIVGKLTPLLHQDRKSRTN